MQDKVKRWVAFDQKMIAHQYDESYMYEMDGNEWDCWEAYRTREEALEWCDSRLNELEEVGDTHEIIKTRRGLDTLLYHELYVMDTGESGDEDGEYELVHSTLTPDLQERLDHAQRTYHDYLDYNENWEPWEL